MSGERVTNVELKNMMEERWKIQDNNTNRLNEMAPMVARHEVLVSNHEKILNGNPDDYKDQGIVGIINDVAGIVSWVKPLIIAMLSWALLGGLDKLLDLIKTVEQLQK